jgi:hypothetical protein
MREILPGAGEGEYCNIEDKDPIIMLNRYKLYEI